MSERGSQFARPTDLRSCHMSLISPTVIWTESRPLTTAPIFFVVPGAAVKEITDGQKQRIFDTVETAYRLHDAGHTINPDSYFLRYPDRPNSRIIALPAHVGGDFQKSGIKWISSFPDNTANNLARASAVLILNDAKTGYPLACLEASLISSTRTAASAALAAVGRHKLPGGIQVGTLFDASFEIGNRVRAVRESFVAS